MSMKMIYGLLMALFCGILPLYAQDQPPNADDIVVKMQSKLNLTQDQVTAITPIVEKYMAKHQELRQNMEDGTADKDSMRSQMKQLRASENQELSQFLSSDQMSQWEEMQSQAGHKHNSDSNADASSGSGGDNPPVQE